MTMPDGGDHAAGGAARELAGIAPDFVGIMHDQPDQFEIRVIDDVLRWPRADVAGCPLHDAQRCRWHGDPTYCSAAVQYRPVRKSAVPLPSGNELVMPLLK